MLPEFWEGYMQQNCRARSLTSTEVRNLHGGSERRRRAMVEPPDAPLVVRGQHMGSSPVGCSAVSGVRAPRGGTRHAAGPDRRPMSIGRPRRRAGRLRVLVPGAVSKHRQRLFPMPPITPDSTPALSRVNFNVEISIWRGS